MMFKLPLNEKEYIFFTEPKYDWKGYMHICLSDGEKTIGAIREPAACMVRELQRLKNNGKIFFGDANARTSYAADIDPSCPQRELTNEQFELLEKAIEEFLAADKRDWVVRIFDEDGEELTELRKSLENMTYVEAEEAADIYEDECYEQNSMVDWHEIDQS
jgi:hypothetical protein